MSGMKWTIVVVVFMACMAVGYGQFCQKPGDCRQGYCCVANSLNQIRGRGICRRLGRLGSTCNLDDVTLESYGNKYLSRCPCASEYTCEPASRYRNGRNPLLADLSQRCRRPSTTSTNVTPSSTTPAEVTTGRITGEIATSASTRSPVTDADGNEIISTSIDISSSTDASSTDPEITTQ
ncbi:hypothetical protein JTE90_009895 [Oedothorax gibbosus]|uniref:Prokineticin domain-containing protein n=1 Tax=Oedothorax gibbosus TaxID=931172 RepID=A0AAV6UX27_9ARAC|nr:hypothetical protein JTE90_009895 [Oedothorax gibbosus]